MIFRKLIRQKVSVFHSHSLPRIRLQEISFVYFHRNLLMDGFGIVSRELLKLSLKAFQHQLNFKASENVLTSRATLKLLLNFKVS